MPGNRQRRQRHLVPSYRVSVAFFVSGKGEVMKQVIDGKIYNTETAELLHEWDNGIYGNDFRCCNESLYKTKKGAYFIAGSGGAMSKYAKSYGNNTGGSEGIEVVTEKEAIRWLEEHDGSDILAEKFADRIEEA
mgnify:FL=1